MTDPQCVQYQMNVASSLSVSQMSAYFVIFMHWKNFISEVCIIPCVTALLATTLAKNTVRCQYLCPAQKIQSFIINRYLHCLYYADEQSCHWMGGLFFKTKKEYLRHHQSTNQTCWIRSCTVFLSSSSSSFPLLIFGGRRGFFSLQTSASGIACSFA
jgi:hypothetical protein